MHVLSDTSALKEQLAASTAKLEGRLQAIESLLKIVTQKQKTQAKPINSSVLKSVLQGPPEVLLKKHKKNHSIGMITVPDEGDTRPEYDFGASEEIEEVAETLQVLRSMPSVIPPTIEVKLLGAFSTGEVLPPYDEEMGESSNTHIATLGINGTNKLIKQLPELPVLNIQCQTRAEIKDILQILTNWVNYKKMQDASYTPNYLALQLVAGFAGLAYEWWRWLPTETKR